MDRFLLSGFLTPVQTIDTWRPQRDSNPRRRRERPVSWTGLDDGDLYRLTERKKW